MCTLAPFSDVTDEGPNMDWAAMSKRCLPALFVPWQVHLSIPSPITCKPKAQEPELLHLMQELLCKRFSDGEVRRAATLKMHKL